MFFLTQADVDFLKMLKKRHDDGNIGNHIRTQEVPGEDAQAPEVFLVRVDETIAAGSTGTGTAGTGTALDGGVLDNPATWGNTTRLRINTDTDEIAVQNDSKLFVYNPFSSSVSAGTVCLAIREKNGQYVLLNPSSGGAPRIRFTIASASLTIGNGTLGCDHVVGVVTFVSCDAAGVAVGDQVDIYDPEYCHFNLPVDLLVGLSGTATKMDSSSYQSTLGTGTGTGSALDCITDVQNAGCVWMIDTLCCAEEEYIDGTA